MKHADQMDLHVPLFRPFFFFQKPRPNLIGKAFAVIELETSPYTIQAIYDTSMFDSCGSEMIGKGAE